MLRWLPAGLAIALALNVLAMLLAPLWWYDTVPGVQASGAYNPHFVRDIGAAYLVTSLGLAWFAWRPRQGWPALSMGACFLAAHACVHVFDVTCSSSPWADTLRDAPGVYLPAALSLWLAINGRPTGLSP